MILESVFEILDLQSLINLFGGVNQDLLLSGLLVLSLGVIAFICTLFDIPLFLIAKLSKVYSDQREEKRDHEDGCDRPAQNLGLVGCQPLLKDWEEEQ